MNLKTTKKSFVLSFAIISFVSVISFVGVLCSDTLKGAETIVGKAKVIDGDTLLVDNKKVRLSNIDSVEKNQTCLKNNQLWNCGIEAANFLEKTIGSETVFCVIEGIDFYRRFLGVCYVNNLEINSFMVENGWAVRYNSNRYEREEYVAKANKRNIWSGEFEKPKDYRKRTKSRN